MLEPTDDDLMVKIHADVERIDAIYAANRLPAPPKPRPALRVIQGGKTATTEEPRHHA